MSKFIAELVGTFIFVLVILCSVKNLGDLKAPSSIPIVVGIGLIAGLFVNLGAGGNGHLNPAVSSVMLAKGDLSVSEFSGYVGSQVTGALLALAVYKALQLPKTP
jgi:glycerol uptake facilitator-like aquaporin